MRLFGSSRIELSHRSSVGLKHLAGAGDDLVLRVEQRDLEPHLPHEREAAGQVVTRAGVLQRDVEGDARVR